MSFASQLDGIHIPKRNNANFDTKAFKPIKSFIVMLLRLSIDFSKSFVFLFKNFIVKFWFNSSNFKNLILGVAKQYFPRIN